MSLRMASPVLLSASTRSTLRFSRALEPPMLSSSTGTRGSRETREAESMASLVTRVTRPGQTQHEERREEKLDWMRLTSRGLTEGAGELHRDLGQRESLRECQEIFVSVTIIVTDQIKSEAVSDEWTCVAGDPPT